MRLYRGLKETYKPERVLPGLSGTDFTDCPFRALQYAQGRNGQLLVVSIPRIGRIIRMPQGVPADPR
jgi:hypothetical protein